MPTTFTIDINESQKTLIAKYAAIHGKSIEAFMLEATLDVIEDAIDLRDWKIAKEEFDQDPITYSAEEIAKKYL
ncbi:MAG: DUF6290 family protein [Deferribacteraceae bacterium]|jgi:uncharacterized protein (DUF1778 family)|nr:DUF6290 family protein [Deferribacteraceae bacterium]